MGVSGGRESTSGRRRVEHVALGDEARRGCPATRGATVRQTSPDRFTNCSTTVFAAPSEFATPVAMGFI
jgi:hypothetical protein